MHGAPDEAARALSSALGHLKGRARDEAALLLAETYQEMGQWMEAQTYIDSLDLGRADVHIRELAQVLGIESRRQLDEYHPSELKDLVDALIGTVRHGLSSTTRARAAVVVAGVVSNLKNQTVSEGAWSAVHEMGLDTFDKLDRSKVLLARAQIAFQIRKHDSGLAEALAAATLLEESGATDTTFVSIQTGVGTIVGSQGRYEESLAPLERAYIAASRLDNLPLMCQAACNRTVSLSRIGTPEEHRRWATLARIASQRLAPGTFERASSAVQWGLASITSNSRDSVEEALEWLDQESREARYIWVQQCIEFYKADLNWLLGRKKFALSAVTRARAIAKEALAIGFVGTCARWATIWLLKEGAPEQAWEELRVAYERFTALDAKDRADVLCSIYTINCQIPVPLENIEDLARRSLARLPFQYSAELSRMGLRLPN